MRHLSLVEKRYDDSFVVKTPMQLDNQMIEKGSLISTIQGVYLPGLGISDSFICRCILQYGF